MYLKPKPANRQLLKPKNIFIILYIVLLVKTDNYICKNEQENAKYCPLPFLVVWLFRKCMCAVLHPAYIIYKSSINSLISSAVTHTDLRGQYTIIRIPWVRTEMYNIMFRILAISKDRLLYNKTAGHLLGRCPACLLSYHLATIFP